MSKMIIGVFCYKRADKLKKCIDSLLTNPECKDLDIVFFSDGFKGENDQAGVLGTRAYIDSITGFKSVIKQYRDRNYSTGPNFKAGLKYLSENYEQFIVIEDDLIVSSNYVKYLTDALDFYRNSKSVFCVSAFNYPVKDDGYQYDTMVYQRFCSYGWGGWADRFKDVVWDHEELKRMRDTTPGFNNRLKMEGYDLPRMLNSQLSGKISTWDVQLQVHVSENRLKVIFPMRSKVTNIGFDEESTNTFGINWLVTPIDDGSKRDFKFCNADLVNQRLVKQIRKPFSLPALVYRKVANTIIKFTGQVKRAN